MKRRFLLVLLILIIASCKESKKTSVRDQFELSVTAKNFPDSTKVVLYNRDIDKNIDSTFVINENFKLSGKIDLPSLSYLDFYDKNGKHLDPYKYFFLENDIISITGEYSNFLNATVEGSNQTDLLTKFDSISANSKESDRLSKEINFLYSNANNQMTLSQLLYKKKQISKDSLLLFYGRLDPTNSNSPKGQELLAYAKLNDLKIGDKFRDITGNDLKGNQHKLSDYQGKVVLLDFWGTGCIPCRSQNKKEFPILIDKYGDDFVMISYSLDTNQIGWEQSSEEDKISWLNISDLHGVNGENAKKYSVQALPNSFLIDQNGIIVKSFLGYRKGSIEIEEEIEKLLR
ncbi:Peroxiredoxin [Nonlabens sp. Hel1_33_55]|uniref:TlpA disulfide reductase family protein n=1 Tax=Nonlabens sp. Hel1_33_55 TaxID=1336802 RepID=UPI000875C383|nr:TlpA disulfide reductase family protein [Nonlabens sp. Hel1_33_55]SCY12391.1 Peroxiredoxin [Nonlabens sp. Hel1_33_55]